MKRNLIEITARIPAWVLSLVAALLAAITISFLRDLIDIPYTYIIWGLILVLASFLICIVHPNHVWIVPILCNILAILPAACDDSFWNTSFGIIIGSGIILSVIAAHLGAYLGNRIARV